MQNHAKILWTTDNKDTSLNMICLYAHNAKLKNWMGKVTILIWGASQKLISEDKEIQEKIKSMITDGVIIIACEKCAEENGVIDSLQGCGINVFHTGEVLTNWINSGENIISI